MVYMKLIMKIALLFGFMILGACSDVEEESIPQPAKFKVESSEYYVQITNENIDGIAFVYRWINLDDAQYVLSISEDNQDDSEDIEKKSVSVADTGILTFNNVRELQFTNRQILECVKALNIVPLEGEESVVDLVLTFSAVNAAGEVLIQDETEAIATATIHVVLSRDLNLNSI